MLLVANYQKLLQNVTQFSQVVKKCREKEVIFPPEVEFPFARARNEALANFTLDPEYMTGTPQDAPPNLPWAEAERIYDVPPAEVPGEAPVHLPPPPIAVEFRITPRRLRLYDRTEGCERCENPERESIGHNAECKARIFRRYMDDTEDKQAVREKRNMAKKRKTIVVPMDGFGSTADSDHDALVLTQAEADMIIGEVLDAPGSGGASSSADGGSGLHPPQAEQPAAEDETTAMVSLPRQPDAKSSLGTYLAAAATVAGVAIGCIFKPVPKDPKKPPPNKTTIRYDMSDYARDAVKHYCDVVGHNVKIKQVPTPFVDESSLPQELETERGELAGTASSVLMKALWLCRLARPDVQRAVQFLATKVTRWSVNDDKRAYRIFCYLWSTRDNILTGEILDYKEDLYLQLYVDADFAGDAEDCKSTSGMYLILAGPRGTFVPLAWAAKKQNNTSRSTTEAEMVSLSSALFGEALPTLQLWEAALGRKVQLVIMEDNTACIQVLKAGYSARLRHISKHHRVNLSSTCEAIKDHGILVPYCPTDEQAADIFTKPLPPAKWQEALRLLHMDVSGKPDANESPYREGKVANKAMAVVVPTIQDNQPVARVFMGLLASAKEQLSNAHSHHLLARHFAAIHNSLYYPEQPVPNVKRTSKLPGYREITEVCCDINSQLGVVAKEFDKVGVLRITKDDDFDDKQTYENLEAYIETKPGVNMHGSLPCTTLTSWQHVCIAKGGVKYAEELEVRRKKLRRMLKKFLVLAAKVIMNGGIVTFEWPRHCLGWMFKELLLFILKWRMFVIDIDGCACGLVDANGVPHLKQWRFISSDPRVAQSLGGLRCAHPKGFPHSPIQGSATERSGYYPRLLCRALLRGIVYTPSDSWHVAPAMPVLTHKSEQGEHREKESTDTVFGMHVGFRSSSSSSSEVPRGSGLDTHHYADSGIELYPPVPLMWEPLVPRVYGAVTKLLDRKQVNSDQKAKAAIWQEAQALIQEGTWLPGSVIDRDALVESAKKSGKKIHLGQLMSICSIKFWEMPPTQHKYKGRIVFRGDCVKDENGAPAIFQELSASPTGINTANSVIAFGSIEGSKVQCSDAVRAYIQSDLDSLHETWVAVPPELRLSSWSHIRRPMCRLVKALYGHPESGAHWERHLEKVVVKIGGQRVPDHPSLYRFPEQGLLLTVYVDDLLLAGPANRHAEIWAKLKDAKINLEPAEDLNRFLGRSHVITTTAAQR